MTIYNNKHFLNVRIRLHFYLKSKINDVKHLLFGEKNIIKSGGAYGRNKIQAHYMFFANIKLNLFLIQQYLAMKFCGRLQNFTIETYEKLQRVYVKSILPK